MIIRTFCYGRQGVFSISIPLQPQLFRALERFVNLPDGTSATEVLDIFEGAFFRGITFGEGYEQVPEWRDLAEEIRREEPHRLRVPGDPPPFVSGNPTLFSTPQEIFAAQARARRWLRELIERKDASKAVYERVSDAAENIGSEFRVRFNGWRYSVDFEYKLDSLDAIALFVVGQIIEHKLAGKVRTCIAPTCENIILDIAERGRRERRWCSNACGSRIRVAAKRSGMSTETYLRKLSRAKSKGRKP